MVLQDIDFVFLYLKCIKLKVQYWGSFQLIILNICEKFVFICAYVGQSQAKRESGHIFKASRSRFSIHTNSIKIVVYI